MILENIKSNQIKFRKEKTEDSSIAASLLTTLIGEAEMIGKNDGNRETTDAEVVAIIKKFLKNLEETLVHVSKQDNIQALQKKNILEKEKSILLSFLPKQMDEVELSQVIKSFIDELSEKNPKQMGKVLGKLKEKYSGQYDGAMASRITKELLS